MQIVEEEYLAHYGILRKSGRYPWGSGENSKTPLQRSRSFLDILEGHKRDGLSEAQIAKLYDKSEEGFPFTTSDLRAIKSRSVTIQKQEQIRRAQTLKDKGYGDSEIARQMSTPDKKVNESTVRSLLAPGRAERLGILEETSNMLKRQVDEKGMIDVGSHVELGLPLGMKEIPVAISKDKFNTALSMLKEEGYSVVTLKVRQVGTGEMTTRRVLLKPGLVQKDAFLNPEKIRLISEKTDDGGRSFQDAAFKKPLSVDPKRVGVRYAEDGGTDADGVIYVRPGVKDVSLGKSQYAQVRIMVGDKHFLKGMAVYKDDLPDGVDLMFNTNKSKTANKLDVMKPLRVDKDENVDFKNPFGAFPKLIGGQILDKDGNVESSMNILNEQGDWDKWSNTISKQVLSKQAPKLAESQLSFTYDRRRKEFDAIKELTNPLIKKTLLENFADETDSSAVHLKAASMPRQAQKVILPVQSLKPTEVFAPTYKNGEKLALIRFPHAGLFEIPEVTVNNNNREARKLFSADGKKIDVPDAIGIHPKVAEHLSGADFDGDHVVVIPNNRGLIQKSPPLEGLKGFDPRSKYAPYHDMKTIDGGVYDANTGKIDYGKHSDGRPRAPTSGNKNNEMGKVTNLIADMTVKGASDDHLAAAVRHSMVVIDAEKHSLDYKASERENGILALKKRYQGVSETGQVRGASTLITRAASEARVPKRKDALVRPGLARLSNATVDIKTGKKVYELTGELNKQGLPKKFRSRKLAETDDAFTLVSEHGGRPIERIYAEHSNKLKSLANEVRKEAVAVPKFKKSPSAAKVYEPEVMQLKSKLRIALKNAPLERQAQTLANEIIGQRRRANPDMEKSELKKIRGQVLDEARTRTGAKKHRVEITDREWEAIQARAVSADTLGKILRNTDVDKLRERATPKTKPVMDSSRMSLARTLLASGATQAEVAERLGVSVSTLKASLSDGG